MIATSEREALHRAREICDLIKGTPAYPEKTIVSEVEVADIEPILEKTERRHRARHPNDHSNNP